MSKKENSGINRVNKAKYPFVWGVQYYRAPTPEPENWETDLKKIKDIGFNSIKYWVQWRWSHRGENSFYFDDLDILMDLAHKNGLMVTLNIILDVAPVWLFRKYPDAMMVLNDGTVVKPLAVQHRQIGGHPGPCYNHPGVNREKQTFVRQTLEHFHTHPALTMWDVWNEPELCYIQRNPVKIEKLACYCDNCQSTFIEWLKKKYDDLESLNRIWGRCYSDWIEVEMPRSESVINDFIDWRQFHTDSLTNDAKWRLKMAREVSPDKICYLHTVPDELTIWNPVSCASDDFALAEDCDVFASTMNGGAYTPQLTISAARGKVCYNAESHLNCGSISMHQRELDLEALLKDFLPQIGMGIKGFMFWQYRPELLGTEAPAWGIVNADGEDRTITGAARDFGRKLLPHANRLLAARPEASAIGIWKSVSNEIFHYCAGNMGELAETMAAYCKMLYWNNYTYRFINSKMLIQRELEGIKVLIMPSPYCLSEAEAEALDQWVQAGGILFSEVHLGGYNTTTGRHSTRLPGCDLAEKWNFHEKMSCSSYHLNSGIIHSAGKLEIDNDDVRKALLDSEFYGGKIFQIAMEKNIVLYGAGRYAEIQGEDINHEGLFNPSAPCVVSCKTGRGRVYYCGTNAGGGINVDNSGLMYLLRKIFKVAQLNPTFGINPVANDQSLHIDALYGEKNTEPDYIVINHKGKTPISLNINVQKKYSGIFHNMPIEPLTAGGSVLIPPEFTDIFAVK